MTEFNPSENAPCSEADDLPTLQEILNCLSSTRRHNPTTVTFRVDGKLAGIDRKDLTIQVAPIAIELVFPTGYEYPEYRFKGLLMDSELSKTRVFGELRTGDSDEIIEATIYLADESTTNSTNQ